MVAVCKNIMPCSIDALTTVVVDRLVPLLERLSEVIFSEGGCVSMEYAGH